MEVIIDNADRKPLSSDKSGASPTEQTSNPQISTPENVETHDAPSEVSASSSKTVDTPKPSTSSADNECDAQNVLIDLPPTELRLLCSLLAREG